MKISTPYLTVGKESVGRKKNDPYILANDILPKDMQQEVEYVSNIVKPHSQSSWHSQKRDDSEKAREALTKHL
jgi:hypothetical protein